MDVVIAAGKPFTAAVGEEVQDDFGGKGAWETEGVEEAEFGSAEQNWGAGEDLGEGDTDTDEPGEEGGVDLIRS